MPNSLPRWLVISAMAATFVGVTWTLSRSRLGLPDARAVARMGVEEKLNLARSLVERAMRATDDPEGAKRMLVLAWEVARKVPPGPKLERIFVRFKADEVSLEHLGPTRTEVEHKKRQLSKRMELDERHTIGHLPYTGMVDNNEGFLAPIPMTHETLEEQTLTRDGRKVFGVVRGTPDYRWREYHVSPDERQVVLEDRGHAEPMEVLDLDAGKAITVEPPDGLGDYDCMYPFGFFKWATDSSSFLVEVTGTVFKLRTTGGSELLAYREVWRVDARSGKAARVTRQEQDWQEPKTRADLKWDPVGDVPERPATKGKAPE